MNSRSVIAGLNSRSVFAGLTSRSVFAGLTRNLLLLAEILFILFPQKIPGQSLG